MSLPIITPPEALSSIASGGYASTKILNDVFGLLRNMLISVQNVASIQAERLKFYSDWQADYTQRMASMVNPTLIERISRDSGALGNAASFNSNMIQTMQNRQSIVGDEMKAMQTVVNQSNDNATSAADLGSSILQELGTLLPIVMGR